MLKHVNSHVDCAVSPTHSTHAFGERRRAEQAGPALKKLRLPAMNLRINSKVNTTPKKISPGKIGVKGVWTGMAQVTLARAS